MKHLFTVLLILFVATGFGQTYGLLVYPSQDASVGFHDGYNSENTNYGDASNNSAFSQPSYCCPGENAGWGLVDFDLSSIPENAIISTAKLSLYAFTDGISAYITDGHLGLNTSFLCRIVEDWDQNIVTWNTKPSITNLNRVKLSQSTAVDQDYININVKNLVQDMVANPESSFGFAIKLKDESPTRGLMFCSSDYFDSSKWPQLKVTYIIPDIRIASTESDISTEFFYNGNENSILINVNSDFDDQFTISIFDVTGKGVYESNTEIVTEGENMFNFSASEINLSGGLYIARINYSNHSEVFKFFAGSN